MCFWQGVFRKGINDFKNKKYNFNHVAEIKITTTANNLDMSYDFYFKQNRPAVEWKLNATINNESLINIKNRKLRHRVIKKFDHVAISNEE